MVSSNFILFKKPKQSFCITFTSMDWIRLVLFHDQRLINHFSTN